MLFLVTAEHMSWQLITLSEPNSFQFFWLTSRTPPTGLRVNLQTVNVMCVYVCICAFPALVYPLCTKKIRKRNSVRKENCLYHVFLKNPRYLRVLSIGLCFPTIWNITLGVLHRGNSHFCLPSPSQAYPPESPS